jgi:WD40 repeat protein
MFSFLCFLISLSNIYCKRSEIIKTMMELVIGLIGLIVLLVYLFKELNRNAKKDDSEYDEINEHEDVSKNQQKKKRRKKAGGTHSSKHQISGSSSNSSTTTSQKSNHPLFSKLLKGHKEAITDVAWSPNGKFVATSSTDSTIHINVRKSLLGNSGEKHQQQNLSIRVRLGRNYCHSLTFAPDSKKMYVATGGPNRMIQVWSVPQKKKDVSTLITEDKARHSANIETLTVYASPGSNNSYLMTSASEDDTFIRFWDGDLNHLSKKETNGFENYSGSIGDVNNYSGNKDVVGTLAAVGSKTKYFKVYQYGKNSKVEKCLNLSHDSHVYDVIFHNESVITSCNDSHVYTWTRDKLNGTWKEVKHLLPHVYTQLKLIHNQKTDELMLVGQHGNNISFIDYNNKTIIEEISNAHQNYITRLKVSPDGELIATVAQNERHAKIFSVPASSEAGETTK